MKHLKRFFVLCLLIALTTMLFACGPSLLELNGGFSAHFNGHMVELNGEYAALTDIYPGENYLKLFDDGTGEIAFSGYAEKITWSTEGNAYSIMFENEPCSAKIEDGIAVVEIDGGIVTYVAAGATAPVIPTTAAPDYNRDLTAPYGTYQGLTISYYEEVMDMAEYYKGPCSIHLDPNGMGTLCLGGSNKSIAWELEEDMLTIADSNGINSFGMISEGILVLDYMETGLQLAFAKEGAAY